MPKLRFSREKPIRLFNHGNMRRDFTYVDDIVEASILPDATVRRKCNPRMVRRVDPDPASSAAPWKIYNIGNNCPEELTHVVALLEKEFGRTAVKDMLPMQPGDVPADLKCRHHRRPRAATSDLGRRRRSKTVSHDLLTGFANTIRSNDNETRSDDSTCPSCNAV